jgi:hypothetical protein
MMRRARFTSSLVIGGFLALGFHFSSIPAIAQDAVGIPGLVGYWPFNGNATDESANNNDGTVHGAVLIEDRFGKEASAYRFDGVNDYIDCGDGLNDLIVPFTVTAWVRLYTAAAGSNIIRTDAGGARHYGIIFAGGGSTTQMNFGDGTCCCSSGRRTKNGSSATSSEWRHLVGVVRGPGDMSLYVDGVDIGGTYDGTGGAMSHSSNPIVIGANPSGCAASFSTRDIDEVRIYNRALTSAEVLRLHSIESGSCPDGSLQSVITPTTGGFTGPLELDDHFGTGLSSSADLDGDGRPELIVGAPGDGPNAQGAIWILSLDENGHVDSEQRIRSTSGWPGSPLTDRELFGMDVAVLGDLNGDGWTEIAVGAPGSDPPGSGIYGSVYILSVDSTLTAQSYVRISEGSGGLSAGLPIDGEFGYSVACPGDVDGDSIPDLAVGAIRNDGTKGAAFVLFLNLDGSVRNHVRIAEGSGGFSPPLSSGSFFGDSIAPLGDLDGDMIPDLLIAATESQSPGPGTAWVLFLNADGSVRESREFPTPGGVLAAALESDGTFGSSLTVLGDVNDDGLLDIAIGDSGSDDNDTNSGAVYLTSLPSHGGTLGFLKLSGADSCLASLFEEGDNFGEAVCVIPDLTGDEVVELAVGASNDDNIHLNSGAVYIFPLDPSLFDQAVSGVHADHPSGHRDSVLSPGLPNPFRESTSISFRIDAEEHVRLEIFDVSGRRIRLLTDAHMKPGMHSVDWNALDDTGRRVSSGVYFCRLVHGNKSESRRSIFVE